MPRKNPFTRVGRPPALGRPAPLRGGSLPAGPGAATTPMSGLNPAVPAAAFSRGGSAGYKLMPSHHDCPHLRKGGRTK